MDGWTDGRTHRIGQEEHSVLQLCYFSVIGAFDLLLVLISFLRSLMNGMDGGGCCFF